MPMITTHVPGLIAARSQTFTAQATGSPGTATSSSSDGSSTTDP
jgi:hypothetical protein